MANLGIANRYPQYICKYKDAMGVQYILWHMGNYQYELSTVLDNVVICEFEYKEGYWTLDRVKANLTKIGMTEVDI